MQCTQKSKELRQLLIWGWKSFYFVALIKSWNMFFVDCLYIEVCTNISTCTNANTSTNTNTNANTNTNTNKFPACSVILDILTKLSKSPQWFNIHSSGSHPTLGTALRIKEPCKIEKNPCILKELSSLKQKLRAVLSEIGWCLLVSILDYM